MIARAVAALALVVAVCAPAVASEARRMLEETEAADWQAVGRLNVAGQRFCTAVLVNPATVLTAGHCLVHPVTRQVARPSRIHFVAGYRLGSYAAHRTARSVAFDPGFDPARPAAEQRPEADIAFVQLAEPIDGVEPIALGRPVRRGERVSVVSYARDRPEAASVDDACRVLEVAGRLARLDCPAIDGMSGAAVLRREGDVVSVGAVIVATLGISGDGTAIAAIPAGDLAMVDPRR